MKRLNEKFLKAVLYLLISMFCVLSFAEIDTGTDGEDRVHHQDIEVTGALVAGMTRVKAYMCMLDICSHHTFCLQHCIVAKYFEPGADRHPLC